MGAAGSVGNAHCPADQVDTGGFKSNFMYLLGMNSDHYYSEGKMGGHSIDELRECSQEMSAVAMCRAAAVPLLNCKGLPPAVFECSKWRAKFEEIDVNGDGEIQKEEIIER